MWATLQNQVDLEDPTSLLTWYILDVLSEQHLVNNRIVMEKQKLFSKVISTNTDVKTDETHLKDITAWSCDMEGHAQKCVERFTSWRTRRLTNVIRFPHFVWRITK